MHWNARLLATLTLAWFSQNAVLPAQPDLFADRVVAYKSGIGFATAFGSGLGYTNSSVILGPPSRETPGDFGGPVTPFAPPYLREQILSLGEGGMVELEFDPPVFDHPENPFGLDFILYGNVGLTITNGDFTGGGITDGTSFGGGTEVRISVSETGETWYPLEHDSISDAGKFFPTDGTGDWGRPLDPNLNYADFAGADLERIRRIYGGSGGGSGFDLAWASIPEGQPETTPESVRFVRIESLTSKIEIDAASSVLPSNAGIRSLERFEEDPRRNGWKTTGSEDQFVWEADSGRLLVHWDSSQPNAWFHRPLGLEIDTRRDFSFSFELELKSIAIGTTPDKPFTFPIAVGLYDRDQAGRADLFRGAGIHPEHGLRNVVEWVYFPDSGFGATVSSGMISRDNEWAFQNSFPLELQVGKRYGVRLSFHAAEGLLSTEMTADGEPFGPIKDVQLPQDGTDPAGAQFSGMRLNALAVFSYHDGGQSPPEFAGSVRATGYVDNLQVDLSPSVSPERIDRIERAADGLRIYYPGQSDRRYWLEHSRYFSTWLPLRQRSVETSGAGEEFFFQVLPEGEHGFFRIRSR